MHLRGKSMRIDVIYPDGRKETLLDVPDYNFNWQITYRAADPMFVPKGNAASEKSSRISHVSRNNPSNPDPAKTPSRRGMPASTGDDGRFD